MPTRKHVFDEVFDSQKVFRLILEALANPLRVVSIKEYADKLFGDSPLFLAVSMTLLDNEVSFNTCENHLLSDEIASLTLAKKQNIESADFVFVQKHDLIKSVIENVKCGTLSNPHKSATVIISSDGSAQLLKYVLSIRDAQNYEYPQGIDLIFISGAGELFAVPRLTRMVG